MLTMMPKRFVRVWIENKKTVTEPISISSFVGINNSAATDDSSQPWWFNFPNSDVPVQPAPLVKVVVVVGSKQQWWRTR